MRPSLICERKPIWTLGCISERSESQFWAWLSRRKAQGDPILLDSLACVQPIGYLLYRSRRPPRSLRDPQLRKLCSALRAPSDGHPENCISTLLERAAGGVPADFSRQQQRAVSTSMWYTVSRGLQENLYATLVLL